MTINITQKVPEASSVGFLVTLTDETGAPLTPTTVTWTLTDRVGNIMNGREDVSITADSTVTIVLSGEDLALDGDPVRLLLVEAVYSSSLGSGLALNEQIRFQIDPLVGVS